MPKPSKKVTKKKPTKTIRGFEDIVIQDTIKMCLYGMSGSGKTTFWSTFPGTTAALLCSSGKGEFKSIPKSERGRIKQRIITDPAGQIEEVIDDIIDGGFDNVVLDHVSEFANRILANILGMEEMPEQLSWGVATQNQYGQMALQVKECLKKLLDLNTNVILVAQQRTFDFDEDDDLLEPYVAPDVSPSIVRWLLPACDYVVQTFKRKQMKEKQINSGTKKITVKEPTGKKEFCLRIGVDEVYHTKFRGPKDAVRPDVIVDPTYEKLKKYL